jgi:Vesicle coat complex COPII, subunit SEC24/subunit SFB2/subunit SFB3
MERKMLCVYTGQRALLKIRCSPGVRIVSFLPKCKVPGEVRNVGFSDSPELILPCVEPDTCIAVELDHRVGGIPKRKNMNDNQTEDAAILCIQTALLYTNPLGRRRVRVSTLALKATESIPEIYCTANFDTLAAFMVRLAISDLMDSPSQKKASLAMARQEIVNRCIQIFTSYRKYGDISTAKQGQLILPETLQLLPLFCLSLLKSRLFRPSLSSNPSTMCKPSPTADERAFHLFHCSNICPSMAMLVVHPCVYDLNNLSPNVGQPVLPESRSSMISSFYNAPSSSYTYDQDPFVFRAANEPYIQLPPLLKPSVSCISDGGLYLIDNGFQFVLYIGRNVSLDDRSTNILSIINCKDTNSSGLRHLSISSSSPFGRRIWKIISQLRKCYSCSIFSNYSRPWHTPVVVIIGNGGPGFRSGIDSSLEEQLIQGLVEDPSNDGMSYEEFLIYICKKMNMQ